MSKTYLIVLGSPNNEEKIKAYREVAGPIMKKYDGIMPPENYKVEEILAGNLNPTSMLRVEFPSKENIVNAFNDPEYLAVINNRDEGFSNLSIFIISK